MFFSTTSSRKAKTCQAWLDRWWAGTVFLNIVSCLKLERNVTSLTSYIKHHSSHLISASSRQYDLKISRMIYWLLMVIPTLPVWPSDTSMKSETSTSQHWSSSQNSIMISDLLLKKIKNKFKKSSNIWYLLTRLSLGQNWN